VGSSLWGFVVGALVVVALTERRRLSSPSFRTDRRDAARLSREQWDEVLPLARSATRARWEHSGEITEDDDWLAGFVILVTSLVLASAWVFTDSWIAPFAAYLAIGATAALVAYGTYAWIRNLVLPPDGRLVLIRAAAVVIFAHVLFRWTATTTYRGISVDGLREVILPVGLISRPSELSDAFGAQGWALAVSIILARAMAVALVLRALLELLAMAAAVRLAEGSQRAFPAWLAQFYPRRPVRRTVVVIAIGAVAVILGSGLALQWWDDVQGEEPDLPVPTVPGAPSGTTVPTETTAASSPSTSTP
jgi:hypothetical protein